MSKMRFVMQTRNILKAEGCYEWVGLGGREVLACSTGGLVYDSAAYEATDDADDGGNGYRCSRFCECDAANEDNCL